MRGKSNLISYYGCRPKKSTVEFDRVEDTNNHTKAQGNQSSCFSTILFIKNIFHNFKIISENQWRSSFNSTFTIKFRSHIFLAQNAWDRKQTSYVIEITEFKLYD